MLSFKDQTAMNCLLSPFKDFINPEVQSKHSERVLADIERVNSLPTPEKIEYQQKIADEILQALSTIDPNCVIAGGAVADWHFGKPAKDLDVYFFYKDVEDYMFKANPDADGEYFWYGERTEGYFQEMADKLKAMFGEDVIIKCGDKIPQGYDQNQRLLCVFDMVIEGVEVQFMQTNHKYAREIVSHFPVNMSRCYRAISPEESVSEYLGESRTYTVFDRLFTLGERLKVLSMSDEIYLNPDKYKAKMVAKYPDYHVMW